MQLSTAAYACPAFTGVPEAVAMPGCESMSAASMDTAQPTLCKAHCDKDRQSTSADVPAATLPMPALLVHGLGWRVAESDPRAVTSRPTPNAGPPPGSPPLFITYLVLRN